MMRTSVQIVHRVDPDGKGYERVYAVLDGFLWDRPGLRTNYPYGCRVSNFFDTPDDYIFGRKAEVWEPLPNRGYLQPKVRITPILSVEMDTRNPDKVVVKSSVLSEERIRTALQGVV